MTLLIWGVMLDCCAGTGNVGITRFGVVVGNVLTTIVLDSIQQIYKSALLSTHGKPMGKLFRKHLFVYLLDRLFACPFLLCNL